MSNYNEGINPVDEKGKKSKLRTLVSKYNLMEMKREIEGYGYSYSFSSFAITALMYVGAVGAVSYLVKLKTIYIILLGVLVLLMIPFIIRSQFNQLYQIKRFDMVNSYLDNVIPLFKKRPLITSVWREVSDLVDGEMKVAVDKALDLVHSNTNDPDVLQSAFKIIETSFPNSRINSVHKMVYSIEKNNTRDYHVSVDNMWLDVQAWTTRVIMFQRELKDKKSKLIMLCLFAMGMSCLFSYMYMSSDLFMTIIDTPLYQISVTIALAMLLLTAFILQLRLSGKWLVDDRTLETNKKALKSFEYIQDPKHTGEIRTKDRILGAVLMALGVLFYIKLSNIAMAVLCIFLGYMYYTKNRRDFNVHRNNVKKFLEMEFPTWVRDVSINLQNFTVINAIEESKKTSSTIMCHYINGFLDEVYKNPTNIAPFNNFLREFKIEGVQTSMKNLFSVQFLGKEDIQVQVGNIIMRNQGMLEKAERMKNENSISGIKLLGFVPVLIFIVQMLLNMVMIFKTMMDLFGSSTAM